MPSLHALLDTIGGEIVRRRKARSWSRRELSRRSGLSERFLADVERGKANLSVLRLASLAEALETSPEVLLQRTIPAPGRNESCQTIALLGLRGAGKSTIGARLAEQLNARFIELDAAVEAAVGLSLGEIFELHGEAFYRRAEREVLERILAEPGCRVLATGGGIVTESSTFAHLQQKCVTVWLKATPEDHWARVISQGDTRPMEGNERAFSHLCAILSEREKLYQRADLVVQTTGRDVDQICAELRQVLTAHPA